MYLFTRNLVNPKDAKHRKISNTIRIDSTKFKKQGWRVANWLYFIILNYHQHTIQVLFLRSKRFTTRSLANDFWNIWACYWMSCSVKFIGNIFSHVSRRSEAIKSINTTKLFIAKTLEVLEKEMNRGAGRLCEQSPQTLLLITTTPLNVITNCWYLKFEFQNHTEKRKITKPVNLSNCISSNWNYKRIA